MLRKALEAFDRRVAVYGVVKYRKDGLPSSIYVEDIRIFKNDEELPSLDEVQGIFKRK